MKVRQVFKCLFEDMENKQLVYAWYEDLKGFIIFEECGDGLEQKRKMTKTEFYNTYSRIW